MFVGISTCMKISCCFCLCLSQLVSICVLLCRAFLELGCKYGYAMLSHLFATGQQFFLNQLYLNCGYDINFSQAEWIARILKARSFKEEETERVETLNLSDQ